MTDDRPGFIETVVKAMGERLDGWTNAVSGMGTARDRASHSTFAGGPYLDDAQLAHMYANEDLAGKIVDTFPEQELKYGYKLQGLDSDQQRKVDRWLKKYNVTATVTEARVWGRLFGGAAIFVGANDGRDPSMPLGLYTSVDFIRVFDKRYLTPNWSAGLTGEGQANAYYITPMTGEVIGQVHASRMVLFGGARTEALAKRWRSGWDFSVLQKPYDALRSNGQVQGGIETLVTEASQTVFSIKGFFAAASAGMRSKILDRIALMDQTRSASRAIVLDADNEKFERNTITFTGLDSIGRQALERVAAAANIPVMVLLGESPEGLNASGDGTIRQFLGNVEADRKTRCEPGLERLLTLLLAAGDSPLSEKVRSGAYEVECTYPPLWTPTAGEAATIRKTQADADTAYITAQVLTPDEVALSRFTEDGWSEQTTIDRKLHEEALKADRELAKNPPEDPPNPEVDNGPSDPNKPGAEATPPVPPKQGE